jgi:polar amino acid transport system substrate-binding protein
MSLKLKFFATLCGLLLAWSSHADPGERAGSGVPSTPLRVLQKQEAHAIGTTPSSTERFQMALGKQLAAQMHRAAFFVELPRNRLAAALETGEGDILCGYLPEWLAGGFDWSRPFIPVSDVVASLRRVAAPRSIADLRGKRIGTVLGFHYPEIEAGLGADFVRDDAVSDAMSLQKMLAGRFDYVLTTKSTVDSQTRRGNVPRGLNILVIKEFRTMCAVSRHGNVSTGDVNGAIDALEKSGALEKLLLMR